MIVDTSALVCVLTDEPEAERLLLVLASADSLRMSAATYVECGIVMDNRSSAATRRRFDELLATLEMEIVDLTPEQARLAREAHRDFGRGSGSSAGLNLGDCFSYALAADVGEPLLYKGHDFGQTDISSVRY